MFLKELEEVEVTTNKIKNIVSANLMDVDTKKELIEEKQQKIESLKEELSILEDEIEKANANKKK